MLNKIILMSLGLFLLLVSPGCNNYSPDQQKYIKEVEEFRTEKNLQMLTDENSPFNFKGKIEFHSLNYFSVDPSFVFKSILKQYEVKDTIAIFGTKGEERSAVRYGYLNLSDDGLTHKVNVYENLQKNGNKYYSIWFTDKTTNVSTYGVGRYLEFELNEDQDFEYTIDFNLAFNPYCAYSPDYSCAIPSKEDYLDLEINAGEKKFHD